jgi:PPM family protein phosphatase
VDVDTVSVPAQGSDVFLLCSDGLTGMVPEDRITEVISVAGSLDGAGRDLIAEANDRGGRDNITVVLFRLDEVEAPVGGDGDQPTEIGMPAPSAEQVAAARSEAAAGAAAPGGTPPGAPPRRTAPLPRREAPEAPARPRRRRRIRGLAPTLVVLAILAALGAGAWVASRAVYFVGTDQDGFVTIYRGLPYEGPGGVDLYQSYYRSAVPASGLPGKRRQALLDHQLRSQQDATDLVRKLELGQVGE